MPKRLEYTTEFKEQAVRFVFESIELTESRKQACERVAVKVNVKPVTLYNWVKAATPASAKGPGRSVQPGSVDRTDDRVHLRSIANAGRQDVLAITRPT